MRTIFNVKVVIGAVLFALVLFGAVLALLWSVKPDAYQQPASTARLNVILAPTSTPILQITITPTLQPTSPQASPPPGGPIAIGDFVQVSGTGGDGLRVHAAAEVASAVRYVAIEAEVFQVKDGPVEHDGYIWWQLEDPYNKTVVGWGVSNYLSVVKNPD